MLARIFRKRCVLLFLLCMQLDQRGAQKVNHNQIPGSALSYVLAQDGESHRADEMET